MIDPPFLAHLVPAQEWDAVDGASYSPQSLATDGFIHLSTAAQVVATVERYYRDTPDLMVVTIDPVALTSLLVYEDTSGHGEFPHLYGPLNLDAVVEVHPYPR
ncbi:MAG: DUF952 domain-containing protein [Acidimicrobiales bacterium]